MPSVAYACAEYLLASSPESTPELCQYACFADQPKQQQQLQPEPVSRPPTLGMLAERAQGRKAAALALASVQEDDREEVFSRLVASQPIQQQPRARLLRRAPPPPSLVKLASSLTQVTATGYHPHVGRCQQQQVPVTASLPPTPPESSSVFKSTLPSPGLGSPLPAYDQLTPSTRAQAAPWTEVIVFPAASDRDGDRRHKKTNVARARGRCLPPVIAARSPTPPYSEDGNSSDSESGECTTPTSDESSFASSLHKAPINAAAPSMMPPIPTINVFPAPSRRASAPSVARAAKINPAPVVRVLAPPVDLVRRRTASPTLSQISAHVVLTSSSRPLRRAASIPPAAATTATRGGAASGESRLPLFLLARRQAAAAAAASKEQQSLDLGPASPAGVSIPTFTVTPPPERADSGRRLKEVLANRM